MIKLKDILKESAPGFENRQFGDPLPTLADVAKEYQEKNGIQVEEGQKREASNIINKFDKAYLNFAKEVRDVIKMVNRSTGEKTDGKIIDKSYSKHLIQLDKLMQSWSRGQQENPNIDESVNEKVASPFSNHLRNAQEEIEWMIGEHNDAEGEGVYDKPKEAMKLLQIAQKSLGKIKQNIFINMKDYIKYNGKEYKRVDEGVDKRVTVKEVKSWLKGLEEFRYRKIPGVDARRITSFVNSGLSETDLPTSLQKKWENAKYGREKHLADKFVKERISKKLTRNESNHPLKEQYNKLFKNKVVL